MLLIMHKICLNESFKKQDCKVLKKKDAESPTLSSSFLWILFVEEKKLLVL